MIQATQITSCIIDIFLIIAVIHFIVDSSLRLDRRGGMLALLVCFFCGSTFFLNRYFRLDAIMMMNRLMLPLIVYTVFGTGSFLKRWGKYLLALLFFSSAEIISIFFEMLVISDMVSVSRDNRFQIISIVVNLAALFLLYYICERKKTKLSFSGTEWALLLLANSLTFILLTAVGYTRALPFLDKIPQEFLQVMIRYSVIFLYLFFVISLVNGKVADHFKVIGQMTRENMEQQLEYFKAYKTTQEEIRRYKHDMKNHFLYLNTLSQEGKVEKMKEYIQSLSAQWENLPELSSTGSTVVDAIVYGKSFLFEQNHIAFSIEGQFTTELEMEPIDLCTIFTNAVDNAVEANMKCRDDGEKYLKMAIKSTRNHYLILLENPIYSPIQIIDSHIETDKKGSNHGFGLKNIERALYKYEGSFRVQVVEDQVFILEMVIPK